MARRYGSFLLRCWALEVDKSRIEIEHVQSGDHTRVSSLIAALGWIEARTGFGGGEGGRDSTGPGDVDEEVPRGEGTTD